MEAMLAVVLETARHWASKVFAGRSDCDDLTCDTMSIAWELFRLAGEKAQPGPIAKFAAKRVKSNRQFAESTRSVSHPVQREGKPTRAEPELETLWSLRDNPAEVAIVEVDFEVFRAAQSRERRKILKALLRGDTTLEISRRLKVSSPRVSQIRRELHDGLLDFWAD